MLGMGVAGSQNGGENDGKMMENEVKFLYRGVVVKV